MADDATVYTVYECQITPVDQTSSVTVKSLMIFFPSINMTNLGSNIRHLHMPVTEKVTFK